MAQTIILKNSQKTTHPNLNTGEVAITTLTDRERLWIKNSNDQIINIAITKEERDKIDIVYNNNHTHGNKTILDGITNDLISNWNTAYNNNHLHTNKSVIDGITSGLISNWNTAYDNNHTHSNKIILDTISQADRDVLNHLFIVDNKLKIDLDTYSTGELSAYGAGAGGTGGSGGGLIATVYGSIDLGSNFSDANYNDTFNAYSINEIYKTGYSNKNRILNLENGVYNKTETDARIAAVVNSAPSTLDTLNELANALGNDPNFATTTANLIGTKLSLSGGQLTGQLGLLQGTGGGITFPNDSFGGSGDSASIKLLNPIGSESTEMTFTMANDVDDIINFSVPSIDGVKINRYTVWNAGNFTNLNQLTTRNFSDIQNKPTTIDGYQITDGVKNNGGLWNISIKGRDNSVGNALLQSGSGRSNDESGSTWLFWDTFGGSSAPWGIRHNQAGNYIEYYGNGLLKTRIDLNNGYIYTNGKANTGDQDLSNLSTYSYVDNTFLKLAGGTMTNSIFLPLNLPALRFGNARNWDSAIGHDTSSYEVEAFMTKSIESKYRFKVGFDPVNFANGAFVGMTNADLEIGAGYCKINNNTVWHSGNDGDGSGLDADLLDGLQKTSFAQEYNYSTTASNSGWYKIKILSTLRWMLCFTIRVYQGYEYYDIVVSGYQYGTNYWDSPKAKLITSSFNAVDVKFGHDSVNNLWVAIPAGSYTGIKICNIANGYQQVSDWSTKFSITNETTLTGTVDATITAKRPLDYDENAASATKLANTRTIWGQNFNGEVNVSGAMTGVSTISASGNITTSGIVYTNGKANTGDQNLSNLSTYTYVDNTFLKKSGGTMTGALTAPNYLRSDGATIWHSGNGGAGSGLDADTLDGNQGSYYTSYTDTAINNIKIGGRNLLLGTKTFSNPWKPADSLFVQDSDGFYSASLIDTWVKRIFYVIPLELNTEYTVSFYAKSETPVTLEIKDDSSNNYILSSVSINSSTWIRYSSTFKITNVTYTPYITFLTRQNLSTVYIKAIKLEKGNKATDWTPAPEDVDASIALVQTNLNTHTSNTSNPHSVTKAQVGLSNVDNTSDANKPVSTAMQTALNLKANLESPTFTGNVIAPTFTVSANNLITTTDGYLGLRSASNEITIGGSTSMYVNYRAALGATPTTWHWMVGDRINYANFFIGGLTANGYVEGSRFCTGYDTGIANSISCSGWFRSNGTSGWVNNTYGGGINMTDTTYVRVYNDKAFKVTSTASDSINTDGGVLANGEIRSNSNITAGGELTAYVASDKRLKKNIKPINNALDVINKLEPVSYNWNSKAKKLNENKTDQKDFGLIAQDVEVILPEIVHNIHNDKYKAIDYIKLIPLLIKSIQEQQKQIEELKEQIQNN